MRRARQKLKVDTFPFLAVLLCAMGSLILLLMVMDRRAKIVARNKMNAALEARQADKSAERAADRAGQLARAEAKRDADWEAQREKLRQALLAQQRELAQHLAGLIGESSKAGQHVDKHHANYLAMYKQAVAANQKLVQDKDDLDRKRASVSSPDVRETATRSELEKLTAELLQLERTLRDLRDLRDLKSRPSEAFSLVPYRGRGDNRKPLYIECHASGLVIHPGATVIHEATMTPMQIREEITRRGGNLTRKPAADPESRTPLPEGGAYVLFLVRPDGIDNYYTATAALRGYSIDFGYELVEADWAFDFSGDGSSQPWRSEGGLAKWSSKGPPVGIGSVGQRGPSGSYAGGREGPGPGGNGGSSGPRATLLEPRVGISLGMPQIAPVLSDGGPGKIGSIPAALAARGPGGVFAGGRPEENMLIAPARPTGLPVQGMTASRPSNGEGGDNDGAGSFSVLAQALPPSGLNLGGGRGPGRLFGSLGQGDVLAENSGTPEQPPFRSGGSNTRASQEISDPEFTPRPPGAQGADGHAGANSGDPGDDDGPREEGTPGSKQNVAKTPGSRSVLGKSGSGGDPGADEGGSLFSGGTLSTEPRKGTATLGKMLANHDFEIRLECLAEGVVLYPRNELYPMSPVSNQHNIERALVDAIEKQIARRQASVRQGEPPYRPMIRLQIQPEGRRSYYWIYPALQGLRIPMIRENADE